MILGHHGLTTVAHPTQSVPSHTITVDEMKKIIA
tara:strand:- start:385 stop:486 length:102 start_codon:yes stop_codon:yes gene_type:complete